MKSKIVANPETSSVAAARKVYPHVGMLIDGEWIYDRQSCHTILNPSDESVLGEVPEATPTDLDRALDAARRGFDVWRGLPIAMRSEMLHRTATLVRERIEVIAAVITLEQGKTLPDARGEVLRSASFLDWDAEQMLRLYGRLVPTDPHTQMLVVREPIGPVAAFTPWNVPLSAPSRKLSGALAAGCSVILKPAEETPAAACLFAQCFMDAGVPPGVINIVFGKPAEVSAHLILSPITRMVTLTGSVGVGKALMRLAAEGMKPAVMELGGHAPVLIDGDVDPVKVAKQAVVAKFRMAGQICASPSRFIVHQKIYGAFVDAFAREADALRVGDGFADGINMGPVVNDRRLVEMGRLVDDAVGRGARIAAGGHRIGNSGYFYAPTVLADVPLDAEAMTTEPFGPLALCLPVADLDEGMRIANSAEVGLAGYLFTNAIERTDQLVRDLQCGVVTTNSFNLSGPEAEFGGYKQSGMGREGAAETAAMVRDEGGEAISIGADLTRPEDVQAMVDKVVATYGGLDGAFNNAGVTGGQIDQGGRFTADWDEEAFDKIVGINAKGVWLCMRAEIRQMLTQGSGAIVNTASLAGVTGFITTAGYSASKHAVVGMTKTAALEYAPTIRVNALCPGYVDTDMLKDTMSRRGEVILGKIPFNRLAKPSEMAEMVCWLLSDRASYATGAAFTVDGGFMAGG